MRRIVEEVFAKLPATGQPLFCSELSSSSMIFLSHGSRHLIKWSGSETGDLISQTIGNNQVAGVEESATCINRYFHFSSQPSHSIHPSRGSSALFVRCLGPAARGRDGAAATAVPKPVWSKYSIGRFSARSHMMYGHHAKQKMGAVVGLCNRSGKPAVAAAKRIPGGREPDLAITPSHPSAAVRSGAIHPG